MSNQDIYSGKNAAQVARNERMTAIAGAALLILIVAELFITANLHGMLKEHIFVGIILTGPLVIKLMSTGYRFIRYYTKSTEFVRKGPPNILLRILAPFLVVMTLLVVISGFGLVLGHNHWFIKIHAASVALWIPLVAVHIYAYAGKVPRLIVRDLEKQSKYQVSGRKWRFGLNIVGLAAGVAAAIIMFPLYSRRYSDEHDRLHRGFQLLHQMPAPLTLGLLAAIIGLFVAIPLLQITSRAVNR